MKKLIIRGMEARYFSRKVVEWYDQHRRNLPWRGTTDPYKIWLSEIILQQTRVNQGLPYYEEFVRKFPNVSSLADAPLEQVLRTWQGLGYYTRARNLHACAKRISSFYQGKFPATIEELKKLPGIGDYTAAAIASIAYEEPVAVVDGNVFRVLARVFGIDTPVNTSQGKKQFSELANLLIDGENPARHNQALMEFGALHCTPKNPKCTTCVLQTRCAAFHRESQSVLPMKLNRRRIRRRYFYYFILKRKNSIAMHHRNGKDIWTGLYDFYLIEKNRTSKPELLIQDDAFLSKVRTGCLSITHSRTYTHILSHQKIVSRFTVMELRNLPLIKAKNLAFYSIPHIKKLPKPVLISRFLGDLQLL